MHRPFEILFQSPAERKRGARALGALEITATKLHVGIQLRPKNLHPGSNKHHLVHNQ